MSELKRTNKKRQSSELLVYPNIYAHYNREMYLDIEIKDEVYPILLSNKQMADIIQKYQDGLFEKNVREAILKIKKEQEDELDITNNSICK